MSGPVIKIVRWTFVAPLLAAGFAVPAAAQNGGSEGFSREVVQPLPPKSASDLSEALRRLNRNSQDGEALLAAGWASLDLANYDDAVGFFSRAEELPSVAGEAKAGLGAVLVNRKRPVEALVFFEEAERLGAKLGPHASVRGLAYDLVGDNGRAQGFYREALAVGPDEETTRRLALSLAIGGDQNNSETILLPLLQHQDLAAYRTRAFALAALGKTEEAVAIANAVMPASLASRIAPYLRYMPKLTKAQQAAAGNFGHFPEADAIGRDDPRIAQYAGNAQPVAPPAAALDARLTPSGPPLGEAPQPSAPPEATVVTVAVAEDEPRPAFDLATATQAEPQPAFSLTPAAPVPDEPAPAAEPVQMAVQAAAVPAPTPPEPVNLAAAFADFSIAAVSSAPAPGAVDITKIQPKREEVKKPEPVKPKPPAHPSRFWVQVATGRDRSALGFDWRRLGREESKLFSGRKAYVVKWGQTNRLVTGPFPNQREATSFVSQLKKAGVDSFTFTSDEGEAVDALPGG